MNGLNARQRTCLMIGHLVMTAEELADKEAQAQGRVATLEAELAELKKPKEEPKAE